MSTLDCGPVTNLASSSCIKPLQSRGRLRATGCLTFQQDTERHNHLHWQGATRVSPRVRQNSPT
eukprot:4640902-Pyramimonas_sp.AAC.1